MIMKKLFTPLLMLAALLSSTQAWAATYNLIVCGVQVTDANKNNITASGISGSISYNPDNKRLTIGAGTTINSSVDGINNTGIDGLSILFAGDATIKSGANSGAGIFCQARTTLTCYSGSKAPNVTIECTGNGNAICSYNGSNISMYALRLTAKAKNNHAICSKIQGTQTPSISFGWTKLYASAPSGYAGLTGFTGGINFTASTLYGNEQISSGTVVNSSGDALKEVYVYPHVMIGACNLGTGTTTLTTNNTGATSASGTVEYSTSSKTLTFTNVNLNGADLLTYAPGDLAIKFSGDGTISSSGYTMDLYSSNTTVTSDGTVTITSTGQAAVYVNGNKTLSISAPQFIAQSTATDKKGLYAGSGTVTLNKYGSSCVYKFAGPGANMQVKKLVMNDMDISTQNSYWNASDGYSYYSGAIAKGTSVGNGTWFMPTSSISYYNLWVAGTHIKQNNTEYFYSPYLTAGTVKYDNSTKTLTLTDATISGQPSDGAAETRSAIYSTISGLTINATGTNNWTSDGITVNLGGGGTNTIKGTGDLKITSNQYHAMNAWNNTGITLARSSGSMSLKGKNRGIYGNNTTTLTINKDGSGALYKFAGEEGNITNLSSLTFGSGVNIQDGYQWFNADEKAVYYRSSVAKCATIDGSTSTWIRSNVEWTYYPIYIAGTQLYGSGSYGNISGCWNKYVQGGYNSYDPDTKTLTLNGATIESVGSHGIEMKLEGNIKLVGTNSLSAKTTTNSRYSAICANKFNITITGDGSLNATSDKNCGIHAHEGIVTITDNVKIDATGDCGGLGSISSDYAGTFIISGNAQVKSNKITNVASLTLEDGQTIVEPFKAAFNSTNKRVEVNGSVAQNVVIQKVEKYDLAVCDVDVNSYNKDDILRDGAFKYDPSTKRLTIKEADIDDPNVSEGVYNYGIEGLNIAIEGENHFRVTDDVFKMKKSTTLSGNGSVKGELTAGDGWGIYMNGSTYTCTLNGPKFEFTGQIAVGGSANNLVIEKGVLAFNPNSSSDATILRVKGLTLGTGMIIAKPEGGVFDDTTQGIVVNGSLYHGHAVISQKGDVNLDGSVTIADAVAVLNAMAGQEVAGNPDVNGDKEVSIADFVAVLNIMAGQ